MNEQNIQIFAYLVPGGEQDSQGAYQQLAALCQSNADFLISVYRGFNRYDGQWHLILIGQPESFVHYQHQMQTILTAAHAQPVQVPVEGLAPLVERFFQVQEEMKRTGTTFVEHHHPLKPHDIPQAKHRHHKKSRHQRKK